MSFGISQFYQSEISAAGARAHQQGYLGAKAADHAHVLKIAHLHVVCQVDVDGEPASVLLQVSFPSRYWSHKLRPIPAYALIVVDAEQATQCSSRQLLLGVNVLLHLLCLTAILLAHGAKMLHVWLPSIRKTEITDGHLLNALARFTVNIPTYIVERIGIYGAYLVEHIVYD